MTETTAAESRPKRRNGRGPTLVSASALAAHLDCTYQYIVKLATDAVIERRGGGYDLDACRLKYIAWLRSENRRSPRSEAAAELARQKSRLLELRIAEREDVLMETAETETFVAELIGMVLTKLGGWPARIGGNDLLLRRKAEALLFELRDEIADQAQRWAEERKPSS